MTNTVATLLAGFVAFGVVLVIGWLCTGHVCIELRHSTPKPDTDRKQPDVPCHESEHVFGFWHEVCSTQTFSEERRICQLCGYSEIREIILYVARKPKKRKK